MNVEKGTAKSRIRPVANGRGRKGENWLGSTRGERGNFFNQAPPIQKFLLRSLLEQFHLDAWLYFLHFSIAEGGIDTVPVNNVISLFFFT